MHVRTKFVSNYFILARPSISKPIRTYVKRIFHFFTSHPYVGFGWSYWKKANDVKYTPKLSIILKPNCGKNLVWKIWLKLAETFHPRLDQIDHTYIYTYMFPKIIKQLFSTRATYITKYYVSLHVRSSSTEKLLWWNIDYAIQFYTGRKLLQIPRDQNEKILVLSDGSVKKKR